MKNKHVPYGMYEKYFKRILDAICALATIVVFWWLYIIIGILVKINMGSPVIFKQPRPGKNGEIFNLYKFRTMTDKKGKNGELLPDEERLTRFGKILRSTSLDEIPEAFCILFGTMSVVGPRPLAVKYLPYYNEYEKQRHDVRPGLTGLAQVSGRNLVNWDERFAYDVKYVKKITFIGDLKIIVLTIATALKRTGIEGNGAVPLEDFDVYRENQRENNDDNLRKKNNS